MLVDSAIKGPICYTLPLFVSKIIQFPNEKVFKDELEFWTSSSLCQAIAPNKAKVGDIGTIGFSSAMVDHAFLYISDYISLDTLAMRPWRLQSTFDILKFYNVDADCLTKGTNCLDKLKFYRCSTLKQSKYKNIFSFVPSAFFKEEEQVSILESMLVIGKTYSIDHSHKIRYIDIVKQLWVVQKEEFQKLENIPPNQRTDLETRELDYWTFMKLRLNRLSTILSFPG
eukprot:TRINITY_DN3184_c0_g1_i2.p1 TRINITY_DN3184_c0_g1~~TRINITY_DN3184_c0_g1_i2.p1  ORF type:complete len:227 (-),score=25.33 TRINITY_DN3184_c0_g1_i2:85-765(-)